MASPSSVLTLGFGLWGSVNLLPTLGFGLTIVTQGGQTYCLDAFNAKTFDLDATDGKTMALIATNANCGE